MNKYVPETYITGIEAPKDILGRVTLTIRGRGFSVGGPVQQVLLDRDGEEPFDYVYPLDSGLYTVESDRIINGPTIEDVEEGSYRIGLVHPKRGIYFTRSLLKLESTGTIRFGDFRIREGRKWIPARKTLLSLSINSVIIWVVFVFTGVLIFLSSRRVFQLAREGRMLQSEVGMLLRGEGLSLAAKKERISAMRRKGIGLRFKFTLFITVLVILVVLGVSFPLGLFVIETQRESLVEGLENQTKVLLESLVSGARNPLRSQRRLEMGLLLRQKSAMADATFVTITGPGNPVPEPYDYVWVTDDPDIDAKIEGDQLFLEKSLMNDDISYRLRTLARDINAKADEQLSALIEERKRLSPAALALSRKGDEESLQQLARLQDQITAIDQEITARLFEIGDIVQSDPEFTIENIVGENPNFTFFKPIVDQPVREGSNQFLRGAVRLGVSTERIVAAIRNSVRTLLIRAAIIAAIAIGIGIAGALLLATIIIQPIKRLVRGVELIRDTEDKEKLKEHVIDVRTKDEISALADTVNQMTMGLVKAAVASKDLTVGKEVQKMFIPLEKDSSGNKGTTGKEETDKVEFFGYYEGAKGVSGDYFDFKKLDEKHYAIIKCDVAGKGVPASLIMVEVATIFLNYFRNWSLKKDGIHLDQLVYSINDLLEERGFKGRFAALIVVIFNVETGAVYMCNAGDNLVHMYDKKKEQMWTKTLPEAPASGVFPSMLVEMQSGFKQVPHQLDHGDAMYLFTDGIEEAQRRFRDDTFSYITCQEPELEEGEPHGNHVKGSEFEELGIPRIQEIVNAVFRKKEYRLVKYHNPVPDETLVFNFAECESTVEDAVMAMVSVEKVFRLYRDPAATGDDRIHIDRKIDQFLKGHFLQYDLFFNHPLEQKEEGEYVVYTHLKEDEQFDDLTILGILRK